MLNAVSWHLRSPLGFSALPLHPQLYRKLMSEGGQRGVRVGQLSLRVRQPLFLNTNLLNRRV